MFSVFLSFFISWHFLQDEKPSLISFKIYSMYFLIKYLVSFIGTLSMLDCNIFPGLPQEYLDTEVNMFLLPVQENDGEENLNKAGWLKFADFIKKKLYVVHCWWCKLYFTIFRGRNIPAVLSAAWLQRSPHLLVHGLQAPLPNPGYASLSTVTHYSHWKKLVNVSIYVRVIFFF